MGELRRALQALPLLLLAPLLLLIAWVSLLATDLVWFLAGRPRKKPDDRARTRPTSASVVIPNWNGRSLLETYLPSVITALSSNPANEIIVVENGSTDGSAEFLRSNFPEVKVVALERNLGFGGGSNAGFQAAKNDVVVLLNSDMRVDPDFLPPLLDGFSDPKVFAVACQIFFSDPIKVREETGLTQGWWQNGFLRVRHRIDDAIRDLYPCFYGGGGSCAFDRRKFLELGGFDSLLAPFYMEDTDLGYMAWKRGWKVLYQPRSVVYHEHRGTIGKRFTQGQIQSVLKKNYILFCWKNIHEFPRLFAHFFFCIGDALFSFVFGDSPHRLNAAGIWRASLQISGAVRSRWQARTLSQVDDSEAFRRPLAGYFRDRFEAVEADPQNAGPRVLFVSPYPICPPIHGGAVFMYQTLLELARRCEVHLISWLERPCELADHQELGTLCASAEFPVRRHESKKSVASILPYAIREFNSDEMLWLIHRQIFLHRIDILQLEYTSMAQYAGDFRAIGTVLFEHDVYFQSIARGLKEAPLPSRLKGTWEYLRALRYELESLPLFDRVQVCSAENRDYLLAFLPGMAGRIQDGLRAGIDTSRYAFQPQGREPFTMLFLGSFRHTPNLTALIWFASHVLPRILEKRPEARLIVAGSDAPPLYGLPNAESIELLGLVDDVRSLLSRYSVFLCPILSGSGVRVKLLEAFAAGIPVVSTYLGAEGLARTDGEFCSLADSPDEFASRTLWIFDNPRKAADMAARARDQLSAEWDMAVVTARLVESYRDLLAAKRSAPAVPIGQAQPTCL